MSINTVSNNLVNVGFLVAEPAVGDHDGGHMGVEVRVVDGRNVVHH